MWQIVKGDNAHSQLCVGKLSFLNESRCGVLAPNQFVYPLAVVIHQNGWVIEKEIVQEMHHIAPLMFS